MGGSAQLERPAETSGYDRHLVIIRQLPQEMSATHPTNAPTAQASAANAILMSEILAILRGSRPPEGDARRAVYDSAVQTLGEGNRGNAISILTDAHVATIRRLRTQAEDRASLGDRAPALVTMLAAIDEGLGSGADEYVAYSTVGNDVATLLRIARGGEAVAAPRAEDQAASAAPLPLIQTPLRDLGPIHLLSSSADESVVALNVTSTPALDSMFGGNTVAQGAMNSLANAYATMANHPNDLAAQQAAARQLHQALSQIPTDKEIWNSTVHPHFNAAMQAFARGDLQTGLSELSQEPSFNAVYGQLNNLYVISVNQRAVSVLRAGVTTRYEFDQNMDAFTAFIRGSAQGTFEPRVLWLGLGLYYDHLLLSGELQQLAVQPGSATSPGSVQTVNRQRVTGTGDVFTATPQMGVGFSAWGHPVEMIIHCSVGYQSYEIGADVQTGAGTTERLSTGADTFFVGPWGAQLNFPGREGQRMMVRMNQISIGGVGSPENVYANVSFEGRWLEGNTLRIRSEVTPQYSYFLQQHRVGFDLRPADFTIQATPNWTLFFGPGFRYDFNATEGIHTLDGYGAFGFRYDRGVSVDIRGGYIGETGGREELRVPGTPYGGLNITLTPQLWFESAEERQRRISGETVPRRRDR